MKKLIIKLLKRFIFAVILIYSLDMLLSSLNFYLPLNWVTILVITALGLPGLIPLVSMFLIL